MKSLKPHTTFAVPASAADIREIVSVEELRSTIQELSGLPKMVLGEGSNVLFVDDFDGTVILNRILGREVMGEDDQHVLVRFGAGENWHDIVEYCVEHNWGGLENMALIPGTVGAAPVQNIGAYGAELVDVFESLEAVCLETGNIKSFSKDECKFAYRDSIFKQDLKGKVCITSVTLRLNKNPIVNTSYGAILQTLADMNVAEPTIADVINAVISIRRAKLPYPPEVANAGSFFKNPVVPREKADELGAQYEHMPRYDISDTETKIPAGWLIDNAGLKGYREGNVGTHDKQALVIVNHGEATGEEVLSFSGKIQTKVSEVYGVYIEREVTVIPNEETIEDLVAQMTPDNIPDIYDWGPPRAEEM